MQEMTDAICMEISMRYQELPQAALESIYFGGGTPSMLDQQQLQQIFDAISRHFTIVPDAEITLEANPDDISIEKLQMIRRTPVNRFSLGVQSFFDEDLRWMNRAHHAREAEQSIAMILEAGFPKTSIDLIYGGPTLPDNHWEENLRKAVASGLNHISAYALTVEPGTALNNLIDKGKQEAPDEDRAARQFDLMVDFLEAHGFEQYEISNFARNKQYAIHNTAYWQNKPYLGIGPSAHSFNGKQRSWNIANNQLYMQHIRAGKLPVETEDLTPENQINEYLMTGLRTMWGCDWNYIRQNHGEAITHQLHDKLKPFVISGQVENNEINFRLSRKARILADGIAAALFF